jgi:hypothetical protein
MRLRSVKFAAAAQAMLLSAWLPAFSQSKPVLTQYERQNPAGRKDSSCTSGFRRSFITSKLMVFDSGDVLYEPSTHTFCDGETVPLPPGGNAWDIPSGDTKTFRYRLSTNELSRLRSFLNRTEVKALSAFMNAGPGVGNFKVVIDRPSGAQEVDVISLLPKHVQFAQDTSLIQLVCMAKDMAQVASWGASATPDWCLDLKY